MTKKLKKELDNLSSKNKLEILKYSKKIDILKYLLEKIEDIDIDKVDTLEWFLKYSDNLIVTKQLYKLYINDYYDHHFCDHINCDKLNCFNHRHIVHICREIKIGEVGKLFFEKYKDRFTNEDLIYIIKCTEAKHVVYSAWKYAKDKLSINEIIDIIVGVELYDLPLKQNLLKEAYNHIICRNLNKSQVMRIICHSSLSKIAEKLFNLYHTGFSKKDFCEIQEDTDFSIIQHECNRYLVNEKIKKYII